MRQYLTPRRFLREDGNSSIEFVIMFPLIILIFCTAFEAAVLSVRQVMLNVAVEDVTRELRIASGFGVTHDRLVDTICDSAVIFPDCQNAISVELAPVDTDTWNVERSAMNCNDRSGGFTPAQEFAPGTGNSLMMVRICAVFKPVFPHVGLGAKLTRVSDEDYAIVAASAFANEPI